MSPTTASRKAGRPMTSAVNWTLLGLVISRSSYGLELAKRFERVYCEVLPISGDSHVYAALNALEDRRMIEIVPGTEMGRQPKPHYQATSIGVRSYEDWLVAQVDTDHQRRELLVRQLAVFANDPAAALRLIARVEREQLKGAGQIGRLRAGSATDARTQLIEELVTEQHRLAVGSMFSWLRYARERFEALATTPVVHDPPQA